jgi:hypothetical protein
MAMDPFLKHVMKSPVTINTEPSFGSPIGTSAGQSSETPFQDIMQEVSTQEDLAVALGMHKGDLGIQTTGFEVMSGEGINPIPENLEIGPNGPQGAELVVDLLKEVNTGVNKMDHFLNEVLYSGKQFSNQELLAIQARILHFSSLTELTVKVAQEGVASVRTVLNTQVQ